jgi:Fungalysin metallopeptidase (M36)
MLRAQGSLRIRSDHEIPGTSYGTPKEIWGFRTPPQRGNAVTAARSLLAANEARLGLTGLTFGTPRRIRSLGAHHVIFAQEIAGKPVHRAYVTVHLDRRNRIYLIKNRAVPLPFLPSTERPFSLSRDRARARALRSVREGRRVEARVLDMRECWFPRRKRVIPAYRVRVHRKSRAGRSEWIVFIHAQLGIVLSKYDNLAEATARTQVFDPNPLARLSDWASLADRPRRHSGTVRQAFRPPDAAYRAVALRGIRSNGLLDGPRVSTSLTRNRVRFRGTSFTHADRVGLEEAMVYYHVDSAIRYIESLGYTGDSRIFNTPLQANARGSRQDDSWYSPGLKTLTFGTGGIDDAEDGETIVHEFGHALQDAICPDFGQSAEASAMGEGFGDYLAASFFATRKQREFQTLVMSWDAFETSEETPPRLRTVDSTLTFESFDHDADADEHENGRIWSATLWDVRGCFKRPKDADRAIIESHFQLDGFTTFARGARAILDADRNLYKGAHLTRLRRVFRRRGIGPVE